MASKLNTPANDKLLKQRNLVSVNKFFEVGGTPEQLKILLKIYKKEEKKQRLTEKDVNKLIEIYSSLDTELLRDNFNSSNYSPAPEINANMFENDGAGADVFLGDGNSEHSFIPLQQSKEARKLANSPLPTDAELQKANAFESMDIDNEDMFGGKRKRKRRKRKTKRRKRKTKKRKGGRYLACLCKKKRRSTGGKKRRRKKTRRRKK